MAVSEAMADTRLLIGGEERSTTGSFPGYDPHDGSMIARAAAASAEQTSEAVTARRRHGRRGRRYRLPYEQNERWQRLRA